MTSVNSFQRNRHPGENGSSCQEAELRNCIHPSIGQNHPLHHAGGRNHSTGRSSTGDLNALILGGLPAVTLGLTTAENLREVNETVHWILFMPGWPS